MQLSLETVKSAYRIHSYAENKVVIQVPDSTEAVELTTGFILMPEQLVTPGVQSELSHPADSDIACLVNLEPEVILFAVDTAEAVLLSSLASRFSRYGIGVELMSLAAACRTYNLLSGEGRKVMLVTTFD